MRGADYVAEARGFAGSHDEQGHSGGRRRRGQAQLLGLGRRLPRPRRAPPRRAVRQRPRGPQGLITDDPRHGAGCAARVLRQRRARHAQGLLCAALASIRSTEQRRGTGAGAGSDREHCSCGVACGLRVRRRCGPAAGRRVRARFPALGLHEVGPGARLEELGDAVLERLHRQGAEEHGGPPRAGPPAAAAAAAGAAAVVVAAAAAAAAAAAERAVVVLWLTAGRFARVWCVRGT
mmetsp:Transcript_72418/g.200771  ORF Transcript_72418/g.200771 Transcript_72418/m.200771 type:complete len:235 (+) Transcript_72418:315-1019(+)